MAPTATRLLLLLLLRLLPALLLLLLLPSEAPTAEALQPQGAWSSRQFSASSYDLATCLSRPERRGFSDCPEHGCSSDAQCAALLQRSRCVCDRELCGAVCVQPERGCDYLAELRNGRKTRRFRDWNENAAGQIVSFACDDGYRLHGPAAVGCQATLEWNSSMPTCQRMESQHCGRPRQIPHTDITPYVDPSRERYNAGDEFKYSCSQGYRSDSSGLMVTAICTRGVWSMHDIVCSVVSCGHPGSLENGKFIGKNYTFGSKLSHFCEGYRLRCSRQAADGRKDCQVRTCQANGRWSGSSPSCEPITCPQLRSPRNGGITKGWNTVYSVVQYSCNDGYRLVGQRSRMCRLNGAWDGQEPRCEIQDCGPPPRVPNAYKPVATSTQYEAKVTYICMPGTKFEGENGGEIICQKSGQWYPPPPRCRLHCQVPVIHLGRALVGKYDGPPATDKVPSDTTLWIKCLDNYRLKQVFYPRCDNGTWTKVPECVPKDCEDRPPLINKGIARFYGTNHGDTVAYKCYVGYEITAGSSSLVCKFGKWVGQVPRCSRKQCPWIRSGRGIQKWLIGMKGAKNPWTRPETRANHEEIVSFKCKAKGFILRGHTHAICINGSWRPRGSPQCVRQMHKRIPDDWLFYRTG